jgi:hypothetical protein
MVQLLKAGLTCHSLLTSSKKAKSAHPLRTCPALSHLLEMALQFLNDALELDLEDIVVLAVAVLDFFPLCLKILQACTRCQGKPSGTSSWARARAGDQGGAHRR